MVDWCKWLVNAAGAIGGVMGLALGLLYFLQEKIIYVPRLPGIPSEYPYYPDAFRMKYEDVWLTTQDGLKLHAWIMWPLHWSEEERRSRPTVMFFQENAGNMAFRLPFLNPLTRVLDCNAFILSYRGYGLSEGRPSEQGLQLDADCALEHVLRRTDIDPTQVILFGRSLGGAVATYAACQSRQHIMGLILENTFTRVVDIVPHTLPFLRPLVGPGKPCNFLVRNRWDTKGRLQQLGDLPILFLSALQDEMLPAAQMKELFEVHAKQPWSIVYFEEGRHLDAYDTDAAQYWPAVQDFLDTLQPAKPLPALPPLAPAGQQPQQQAAEGGQAEEDRQAEELQRQEEAAAMAAAAAKGRQEEVEEGWTEI